MLKPNHRTRLGAYYVGDSKYLLRGPLRQRLRGKVQLILTSPPYRQDMLELLRRGKYNNGRRPSNHGISKEGFLRNNGGSIAQNVLEIEALDPERPPRVPNVLRIANTGSNDFFFRECRARDVTPHPARMPASLASFFVHFLTDPGDLVLDPFAGRNTTGFVAELAGRRWVAIDQVKKYVEQSRISFREPVVGTNRRKTLKIIS